MPLGVKTHYATYVDEDEKDVTLTYDGKPCKRCGTTKKYTNNRSCVKCKVKGGALYTYKPKGESK